MSDTPETPATPAEPDRAQVVKQLLKQVDNPANPFSVRASAVAAIRKEFPTLPEAESADEAYQEAARAEGTEAYRGYVSNLSPKQKGGQAIIQRLKKAVLAELRPARAPSDPAAPKAPRAKKGPSNPCLCGCGATVHNHFAPGHDAKVKGLIQKVVRGQAALDTLPATLLPHLKDFAQRWKFPTDTDGNLVVTPVEPKPVKTPDAPPAA